MGFSSPSILTSNSLYAYVCGRGQKDDCVSALRVVDRGCQRLCSRSWNAVHVERDLPGQLRPPPPPAYRERGERLRAVCLDQFPVKDCSAQGSLSFPCARQITTPPVVEISARFLGDLSQPSVVLICGSAILYQLPARKDVEVRLDRKCLEWLTSQPPGETRKKVEGMLDTPHAAAFVTGACTVGCWRYGYVVISLLRIS